MSKDWITLREARERRQKDKWDCIAEVVRQYDGMVGRNFAEFQRSLMNTTGTTEEYEAELAEYAHEAARRKAQFIVEVSARIDSVLAKLASENAVNVTAPTSGELH